MDNDVTTSRARTRLLRVFLLAVCLPGLAFFPGSANGDTAPAPGTPATVSADALASWQVNGVVWDSVVVGNTAYVTGAFTRARPPGVGPGGAGEVAANNIFAFDVTTGSRVASFSHQLNGRGLGIVKSPNGSRVYVVGDFTTVDGLPRGHVAGFDTATNALDPTFRPSASGKVATVTADNSTVWVGGNFFSANGQTRRRLASFRATDGAVLPWAPKADDEQVTSMVLTPDGQRVIVGGRFSTLNSIPTSAMGSVDAVTGANLPWAANQKIRDAGTGSGITSLSTDGTSIYGTAFAWRSGNFEGLFSADPSTGALRYANDCHGDTYDAFPVGQAVYTVSHAHDCSWIRSFPQKGRDLHHALAFTTYPTTTNIGPDNYGWNYSGVGASQLLHWFPTLSIGSYTGQNQAAWTTSGNNDYVVLGGEFPSVNGVAQQGLVRFAVRAKAPNKRGPVRASGAPNPTAQVLGGGQVRVTWQAAYDMDNAALTYNVYRSGTAAPVYTTTASSSFWNYPMMSFTNTGVPPGSYTYTVRASDPLGNTNTMPPTGAVTAKAAAPSPLQKAPTEPGPAPTDDEPESPAQPVTEPVTQPVTQP